MPQISEHPPPYVHDWSSFPPPLLVDVGHRAWAFQLAFENAREIVKWTILQTFEVWLDEWAFKRNKIYRQNLQQAYDEAPEELKQAVDWQLKWDTPVIMISDQTRRWHEHVRLKEAGAHEDILPSRKFEAEFDAASPSRQRAIQLTVTAWKRYNESVRAEPPQRDTLMSVYENASSELKLALCFVLEMGLTHPIQRMQSIDERKADLYMIVARHRAEAPYWDAHARAAGFW